MRDFCFTNLTIGICLKTEKVSRGFGLYLFTRNKNRHVNYFVGTHICSFHYHYCWLKRRDRRWWGLLFIIIFIKLLMLLLIFVPVFNLCCVSFEYKYVGEAILAQRAIQFTESNFENSPLHKTINAFRYQCTVCVCVCVCVLSLIHI